MKRMGEKLEREFGRGFEVQNLRRMVQFVQAIPSAEIVATLSRQLSWSHFVLLIPLKIEAARLYYPQQSAAEYWSVRELRRQIERKACERSQIATPEVSRASDEQPSGIFKDPYFFDFLGLRDGHNEADLEAAILLQLKAFILELGSGFAFVERKKQMIIDGEDFYLDLLFFHRRLRRLVAIELKLGRFKAARKEQVELLQVQKDGITVAEYWTELPPKAELERQLRSALAEARERIECRRLMQ